MEHLHEILWRNCGQVLTAELIVGILHGLNCRRGAPIDLSLFAPMEYGNYVFHVERYADALPELRELHAAHWDETEKYRHGIALDPDYDGFIEMDRTGRLLLFTVRTDAGELVGQTTMKLHQSMHSKTIVANEDSLYLRRDHRGNLTKILTFIKYVENVLDIVGAREVRVSSKLVNGADRLMMRAGYTPFATQLVKMLGDNHVQ